MKFKRLFVVLMCLLAFSSIYAQKFNLKIGSVAPDNSPVLTALPKPLNKSDIIVGTKYIIIA